MKLSQKIDMKRSETRQKANALLALDSLTEEQTKELEGYTKDLETAEVQYRAAVNAEELEAKRIKEEQLHISDKPESIEVRSLIRQIHHSDYLSAVAAGVALEGPAKEYNEALNLAQGAGIILPLRSLDPEWRHYATLTERQNAIIEHRMKRAKDAGQEITAEQATEAEFWASVERQLGRVEHRADAVVNTAADQTDELEVAYLNRVFRNSAADFLGCTNMSVPAGEPYATVMATGGVAEFAARNAAIDADAATFSAQQMEPVRMGAAYLFNIEDLARSKNLEERLIADLRMVMSDKRDDAVINGDALLDASAVSGIVGAAEQVSISQANLNQINFVTFMQEVIAKIVGVDGLYSYVTGDKSFLAGPYLYNHMVAEVMTNLGLTASEKLTQLGVNHRASRFISTEAEPAAGKTNGVVVRKLHIANAAIIGMWPGIEMIRDIYTGASKGQVRVTMNSLWNHMVVRNNNWTNIKRSV